MVAMQPTAANDEQPPARAPFGPSAGSRGSPRRGAASVPTRNRSRAKDENVRSERQITR